MTPIEAPAPEAILVGDPRRAFALAQELMVQPRMSHQARGLWGYTGETQSGTKLTVQSTGTGGPSAVAVIGDLAELGVNRMIRLGTCLGIDSSLRAGATVLVETAISRDGASRLLGDGTGLTRPDQRLYDLLTGLGCRSGTIASHDLVGRLDETTAETDSGPEIARDLQTAATFAMTRKLGVSSAALLIVAEDLEGRRLGEEELWKIFGAVGRETLDLIEPSEA